MKATLKGHSTNEDRNEQSGCRELGECFGTPSWNTSRSLLLPGCLPSSLSLTHTHVPALPVAKRGLISNVLMHVCPKFRKSTNNTWSCLPLSSQRLLHVSTYEKAREIDRRTKGREAARDRVFLCQKERKDRWTNEGFVACDMMIVVSWLAQEGFSSQGLEWNIRYGDSRTTAEWQLSWRRQCSSTQSTMNECPPFQLLSFFPSDNTIKREISSYNRV